LIVRFAIAFPLLAQSIERASGAMLDCNLEQFKSRIRVCEQEEN
jgi:hypothetical protein